MGKQYEIRAPTHFFPETTRIQRLGMIFKFIKDINIVEKGKDTPLHHLSLGFKDYGKFRNFYIEEGDPTEVHHRPNPIIDESYLPNILNAPEYRFMSKDEMNKMYGLFYPPMGMFLRHYMYVDGALTMYEAVLPYHIFIQYIRPRLEDAMVIAFHVVVPTVRRMVDNMMLLLVEDKESREFLNKLTFTEDRLSKYISDDRISVEAIIQNLDLYHCLSYGV